MTNAKFCENVLALIGDSYEETDCIAVIRKAAGIRCQGTNWLWRSYKSRGKYQYLIERMERAPLGNECRNGSLVFRIKYDSIPPGYDDKPNCHHVGVIIGDDVIQSQQGRGVYQKPYDFSEWDGYGWLKMVDKPKSGETLPFDDPPEDDDYEPVTDYEPTDHEMIKALYDHFIID